MEIKPVLFADAAHVEHFLLNAFIQFLLTLVQRRSFYGNLIFINSD